MSNTPLSDVTVIAAVLGIFFLIVAFYKSIFHKRRTSSHGSHPHSAATATTRDDQPVKLANPFQQVPVDTLPLNVKQSQQSSPSFYPAFPHSPNQSVSAFRQFNPNKEFNAASSPDKNEAAYEWE